MHLGCGGVGQQGHQEARQRARAVDPPGEMEGGLVPTRPASWRPGRVGLRSLGMPRRRHFQKHGGVHGGLRCWGPGRRLGGALGWEGGRWWERRGRRRQDHWGRLRPALRGQLRGRLHSCFLLGGLALLERGGEKRVPSARCDHSVTDTYLAAVMTGIRARVWSPANARHTASKEGTYFYARWRLSSRTCRATQAGPARRPGRPRWSWSRG